MNPSLTDLPVNAAAPAVAPVQSELRPLLRLLAVVCLLKLCHIGLSIATLRTSTPQDWGMFATGYPLVAWDSISYLTIMTDGYPDANPDIPWVAGFFPLYSLTSLPLAFITSPELASIVMANLASLAGFVFFYLWCKEQTGDAKLAFWSGILLAVFPLSFFFTAAYTEGLFFLLTALTLWLCGRQRFWLAALAIGLATATRPTGVALVPVLALLSLESVSLREWSFPKLLRACGLSAVACSGLLAFATYEYFKYGDFTAYVAAQRTYGASSAEPSNASANEPSNTSEQASATQYWAPDRLFMESEFPGAGLLRKLTSPGAWNRAFAWGTLLLALATLPFARRVPYPYLLLAIIIFALGYLPGMGVRITSIARFMTAALPLFLVAAMLTRSWPRYVTGTLCSGAVALQFLYAWLFSRGGWCG